MIEDKHAVEGWASAHKASSRAGRPALYDWDVLLDGQQRVLVRGEDFECKPNSFGVVARREARDRGLKVRVLMGRDDRDGEVLLEAKS